MLRKTSISVGDHCSYASVHFRETVEEPPAHVRATYWQSGNDWKRSVNVEVDISYVPLDSAIANLKEAAIGLEDPTVEVEAFEEYGSLSSRVSLDGVRLAIPEEIKWIEWQKQRNKEVAAAKQDEIKNAAIEYLKAHPELAPEILEKN